MKIFFLCLLFISINSFSQNTKAYDSLSVVFSVPSTSQSTNHLVEAKIKTMNGVVFRGYCTSHNVYSIKISTQFYPNKIEFVNQLKNLTALSLIHIKENTEDDFFSYCEDYPNYQSDKDKASKK